MVNRIRIHKRSGYFFGGREGGGREARARLFHPSLDRVFKSRRRLILVAANFMSGL